MQGTGHPGDFNNELVWANVCRRHTTVSDAHVITSDPTVDLAFVDRVTQTIVSERGSVALIQRCTKIFKAGPSSTTKQVVRIEPNGHRTLLDDADWISAYSLRLRGDQLSWLHSQARRTATMR